MEANRAPYETILQQSNDNYAPPDQPVLAVSVIGPDVFLEIADVTETSKSRTYTKREAVVVSVRDLARALDSDAFIWAKSREPVSVPLYPQEETT